MVKSIAGMPTSSAGYRIRPRTARIQTCWSGMPIPYSGSDRPTPEISVEEWK